MERADEEEHEEGEADADGFVEGESMLRAEPFLAAAGVLLPRLLVLDAIVSEQRCRRVSVGGDGRDQCGMLIVDFCPGAHSRFGMSAAGRLSCIRSGTSRSTLLR